MRRFYAPKESFQAGHITLKIEETRHLRDVLRLREGAKVRVFDGAGKEFLCEIKQIEKRETKLTIIEEVPPFAPASNLDLTLAVALLKGEKFDLVIQKAVELGVTRFVPLFTRRCDVKFKDSEKRHLRWEKIALEAAKQSGRAELLKIEKPLEFEKFIKIAEGTKVLFSERNGEKFSVIPSGTKITALIGSEGGWEDSELETAEKNGFLIVTLGGSILRAETAAMTIAGLLQHRFGNLN